jgi:hypothetical protein
LARDCNFCGACCTDGRGMALFSFLLKLGSHVGKMINPIL